ncbi:MAG: 4-(cytidine 5'-diphospho)-2-C-methyl-D-erythritol kinase [Oscillospiraceae bacterium]
MKTQTISAYAKLNLTLDILGKRDDGYHELRMVMQTVSLCDDVTVTLTDGTGVACRVAGAELPCDERNLAVKAANAFCEALGYHGGIDITLTKRIPSEAGMAGGSADAAAVLCVLRDLIAPTLTDERLEDDRRACRQRRTVLCPRRHAACRGPG